jgi:hypothetical protein
MRPQFGQQPVRNWLTLTSEHNQVPSVELGFQTANLSQNTVSLLPQHVVTARLSHTPYGA